MCYRARASACCSFSRKTVQLISAGKWMVNSSLNGTYRDISVQDVRWNTSENTENWLQDPDNRKENRDAWAAWPGFSATSSNLGRKFGLLGLRPVRTCDLRLLEHTGQHLSAYWQFIDPDTLLLFPKTRCHFLAQEETATAEFSQTQPNPEEMAGLLIHPRGHGKKDLSCWKPESALSNGLAEATELCIKCRQK